jgi:hypothetical protein
VRCQQKKIFRAADTRVIRFGDCLDQFHRGVLDVAGIPL